MDDMEKHVGLNPAWFEPGPDGVSPFEREMQKEWRTTNIPKGISAAFRALMSAEPPALQVGDVVRLDACPEREGHAETHLFVGRVDAIEKMADTWDIQAPCAWFTIPQSTTGEGIWWPVSALTLIRRAGEVDKDAEIARLKFLLDTQASDYKARCATFQLVEEDRDRLVTESNDAAKTVKMLKADIDTRNELINERDALINQQRDEIAQLTDELHARNDEIVGLRARLEESSNGNH
jgi:hypothetical protein